MTQLSFPKAARPLVSIVMPTYGGWEWTSPALAAVRDHTPTPYELVVCDNGSTDETPERLAALEGARVILNGENVGYAAACNQGAALARSPYLVFLNSDAMPHEGWLPPLVECMERDPTVGAVGARLLNPDGSLQEAGCTVLGDGATIPHGGGDGDEEADAYEFARAVDYVSGACLATRRSTFHRAGGFDVAYGVGYFEDVDLCFRLRTLGYRVMYEPRSVLTHVGGGSSPDEQRLALAARNLRLFRPRWKHLLAGRPSASESEGHASTLLRDLSATDRILLVAGRRGERAGRLLDGVLAVVPGARMTVLGSIPSIDRLSPLVEYACPEDDATWLRGRRFLYDTVILVDLADAGRLRPALDDAQPQALLVADVDVSDRLDDSELERIDLIVCASPEGLVRVRRAAPTTPAFVVTTNRSRSDELVAALAATGAAVGAPPTGRAQVRSRPKLLDFLGTSP